MSSFQLQKASAPPAAATDSLSNKSPRSHVVIVEQRFPKHNRPGGRGGRGIGAMDKKSEYRLPILYAVTDVISEIARIHSAAAAAAAVSRVGY